MENLQSLEMSALVDLLSSHTQRYTQFFSEGGDLKEFESIKLAIGALQAEIGRRTTFDDDTPTAMTDPPEFVE